MITLIDENPGFFKLKSLYRKPKYISIQIAFKDNNFYDYIDNFTKNNKNYKFQTNYTFVLGKNDQKKYKRYINGKIICLGSIKNNNFVKKNRHTKKIKNILFISSLPINQNLNFKISRGYKIFNMLKEYCKKNKLKLLVLSKHGKSFEKRYRDVYGGFDWYFIPKENDKKTYQVINKANFIVFDNSTLGYEVLTKNIKGVCFPKVFPYKNYSKRYSLSGPFWNCKLTQANFENKISEIIKISDNEWRKIIKKTVRNIIFYNPSNKLLKNKLSQLV